MIKRSLSFIVCVIMTLALALTTIPMAIAEPAIEPVAAPNGWSTLLSVNSPSKVLTVNIYTNKNGEIGYTVDGNDGRVIELSSLGITTVDCDMTSGLKFNDDLKIEKVTDEYTLVSDKKDKVSDTCNEAIFSFTKGGKKLTVTFRVYDNGAAHRYSLDGEGQISIKGEKSGFNFNDATTVTYQPLSLSYESHYTQRVLGNETEEIKALMPAMFEVPVANNKYYVLVTESNVWGDEPYCASNLHKPSNSNEFSVIFGQKQDTDVTMTYPFNTPWRLAVISKDINEVSMSTLVTSLAPESETDDTNWVTTGRSSWSWWTTGDPITPEEQRDYIDYAAENGYEWYLVDYGWYLWENYEEKLADLAKYAKEKGVKLSLWYGVNNYCHPTCPENSLVSYEKIEQELKWTKKIGFDAVKVDFIDSDAQKDMQLMKKVAEVGLENEIVVVFHGCQAPRGEMRKYPNVVSYEGIYGKENQKWVSIPTQVVINQILIRNAVGPADFTPNGVKIQVPGDNSVVFSAAFDLATIVVYQSGITHYASAPSVYRGNPALPYLNLMPSKWNDSRIVEAKINEYATVARRNGERWFIGSVTGVDRTTNASLSFLGDGTYNIYLYIDVENGLEIKESKVTNKDKIALELKANEGFAAIISKESLDLSTPYDNLTFFEAEEYPADKLYSSLNHYASNNIVYNVSGFGSDRGVKIPYTAKKSGTYKITLYAGGSAQINVDVNGETADSYEIKCSDDIIREYSSTVELKLGENEILIYAEENMELFYFVDFDKVSVEMISKSGVNWLLIIAIGSTVAVLAVAAFVFIRRKNHPSPQMKKSLNK
ncbi:MAG: glycoside hydrolase family 97 catalytic domain-containing protein [Clostridia bacterium]|nr:glycoside hydrolase family 97 catalytic domain-containing protein [Clostridia bacterium]